MVQIKIKIKNLNFFLYKIIFLCKHFVMQQMQIVFLWFNMSIKCDFYYIFPQISFYYFIFRWNSLNLAPRKKKKKPLNIPHFSNADNGRNPEKVGTFSSFLKSKYGCTILTWSVHICFCIFSVYVCDVTYRECFELFFS